MSREFDELPPENPIAATAKQLVRCFNNIVDSKLSAFSASSTLSPVAIDASNPPFSITKTVVEPDTATIYFLVDASEDNLMQHLSTPLVINCTVIADDVEYNSNIKGTLNELVANTEDLPYESYIGYYIDDRDIKHRPVILRPTQDTFPYKVSNASGQFVWGSLPVQALETTIDGTVYQIPLSSRIVALEAAFAQLLVRFQQLQKRLRPTTSPEPVVDGDDGGTTPEADPSDKK